MKNTTILFSKIALISHLFGIATAATIYLPRNGSRFDAVDPLSGTITNIAALPFSPFTDGFTIDPHNGIAYFSNRSQWAAVILKTGAVLSPPIARSVFNGEGGFKADSRGHLVMPRSGGRLDTVNPLTGDVTNIASLPFSPFTDGFTVDAINDIAYLSNRSRWAAVNLSTREVSTPPIAASVFNGDGGFATDSSGRIILPRAGGRLDAVDPLTGVVTNIANIPFSPFTDGFAVDPINDVAYLTNRSRWASVDLTTGAVTTLPVSGSVFNGSGGFEITSTIPEPQGLALISIAAFVFSMRRRV